MNKIGRNIILLGIRSLSIRSTRLCSQTVNENVTSIAEEKDMPDFEMENPYKKEKRQCILCKYKVELDYKNVRLLSQFVSPVTGLLYDKHITGLCDAQQKVLEQEVRRAQISGLMPHIYRYPKYANDPKLFNPFKPQRPHPY